MTRHYNPMTQIPEDDEPGVTCNRCGTAGLHWKQVTAADGMSEHAVLFDDRNRRHACAVSADDFSELA